MKITAIIQARMSSTRLPGKVLLPIIGKPMLQYLLESLAHCQMVSDVIVATSMEKSDDILSDFCEQRQVRFFRGPLDDVSLRFVDIIKAFNLDAFMRIGGDSPLFDYVLADEAATMFRHRSCDLVTNVFPRSFPKGESIEIVRAEMFLKAYPLFDQQDDFEHVTHYFYRNSHMFNIHNFSSGGAFGHIHLAVDHEADFQWTTRLLASLPQPHWMYRWQQLIELHQSFHES